MKKDVARRRQVLDIVIIRGRGDGLADPCDGLEGLRTHTLMTYKSGHALIHISEPTQAQAG